MTDAPHRYSGPLGLVHGTIGLAGLGLTWAGLDWLGVDWIVSTPSRYFVRGSRTEQQKKQQHGTAAAWNNSSVKSQQDVVNVQGNRV